jgi:hypothetical protein
MKEVNFDQKYFENCKISFQHRYKLIILIKITNNTRKLQNFISISAKTDDFDQKQPKILENWGRFIGMKVLLINLGRGQLWFTVEVNSKY